MSVAKRRCGGCGSSAFKPVYRSQVAVRSASRSLSLTLAILYVRKGYPPGIALWPPTIPELCHSKGSTPMLVAPHTRRCSVIRQSSQSYNHVESQISVKRIALPERFISRTVVKVETLLTGLCLSVSVTECTDLQSRSKSFDLRFTSRELPMQFPPESHFVPRHQDAPRCLASK